MTKLLQNSKIWFIFHKKSLSLIQFTPVWCLELGLAKKQLVAAIRDLLETQNGPKQPKMTNFSLYAKLMKNDKIFPFKPSNIQECR